MTQDSPDLEFSAAISHVGGPSLDKALKLHSESGSDCKLKVHVIKFIIEVETHCLITCFLWVLAMCGSNTEPIIYLTNKPLIINPVWKICLEL